MKPSDPHLLRTFAAVPPGQRVLDLVFDEGRHARPLTQLGFEVTSCRSLNPGSDGAPASEVPVVDLDTSLKLPFADDVFDWVVLWGAWPSVWQGGTMPVTEARRVIKPGGWIYVSVPCSDVGPRDALGLLMRGTGWAVAEPLVTVEQPDGRAHFRGIFRRVEAETAL